MARSIWCSHWRTNTIKFNMRKKEVEVVKEVQEVIVLVHDPILGSRYELREVEVEESENEEAE